MYMYGDFPIRTTINTEGYNNKRILLIGDSFKMPFEYFITTQFEEVYTINLRTYKEENLAEYIEEVQPEIVIICTSEGTLSETCFYDFGIEKYLTALEATSEDGLMNVIDLGDAVIEAQENNNNNFSVLYTDLEPNQTYTLTVDSTAYEGGDDLYVQMTLQNLSTNTAVYNRYFDANSDETQKWIFTTLEDANGVYAIYLYAGTKGHTADVSVDVTGIELRKGVFED